MWRSAALVAVFFMTALLASASETPDELRARLIEAAPDWVLPVERVEPGAAQFEPSGGERVLLWDRQTRLIDDTYTVFYRRIAEIADPAGVKANSVFNVEYDPTFQSEGIVSMTIQRDGEVIDALATAHLEILRRERNLSMGIYDGSETLYVRLNDVRPGDIVERVTVSRSANPIAQGNFSDRIYVEQSRPYERAYARIEWPESLAVQTTLAAGVESVTSAGWRGVAFGPVAVARKRGETGAPVSPRLRRPIFRALVPGATCRPSCGRVSRITASDPQRRR
jgi:Domain of Unknown Function with PDB structure (DUF3857)